MSLPELLNLNWYLEPKFKQAIVDKYKSGDYDTSKLEKIKVLVVNLNTLQDEMIESIVAKDPLFLVNFEHGLQTEGIEKIKSLENSSHREEIDLAEKELEQFLKGE